jgi:hypothetical protein
MFLSLTRLEHRLLQVRQVVQEANKPQVIIKGGGADNEISNRGGGSVAMTLSSDT